MIVYLTTNIINGNKYIGQDLNNNPKYLGSGKVFKEALKKYGKQNFKKEILANASSKEELSSLEIYYIDFYNAQKSPIYYNIARGGEGGITSDQTFKKVKVYQFNKELTLLKEWNSAGEASKTLDISRSKIVSACTKNRLYKEFFWSKDEKIILKSDLHQKFKRIEQYDLDNNLLRVWDYLQQIADTTKFNKSNIHKCCKGKYKTAYGFKWKYL